MTYAPFHRANPTSVTVTAGGTPVGVIANVNAMIENGVYQIPELAANPGFDIRFNFTGLQFIPDAIVTRLWYDGAHQVEIHLWDYVVDEFVLVDQVIPTDTYLIKEAPFPPQARFVSSGAAIMRFLHNQQGNASEDIYWDYVALWHRPFPPVTVYT